MRTLIERIIRILKRDPGYRLETPYGARDLATVVWHRGWQMLRGLALWPWLGTAGLPLFRGRRVVVEHAYLVRCGSSCILEDGVFISALSERGVQLGRNVTIAKQAVIQCSGVVARRGVGLEIGDNSAVGAQSFLGAQGGIRIGQNVIMGPGVRIFSENHRFEQRDLPIRLQGEIRQAVVIEDDCWIGSGATVLAGVTVGPGCVVAAGAVVTRSVDPYSVCAGVPARVVSRRGDAAAG